MPNDRMASVSLYLLAAIGLIFVLQLIIPSLTDNFIFDPTLAISQPWRFVTSMFLHANITHIFFNAYALFMFGIILERKVSDRDYLTIYFSAGLLGGLLYYLTYVIGMIPPIPALGASGAIYGILGAVAVLMPDLRIFFWFIPMRMRDAAILWVIIEFLGSLDISSGVASAAHLGGLLFGIAYAWHLKQKIQPQPYAVFKYDWQQQ